MAPLNHRQTRSRKLGRKFIPILQQWMQQSMGEVDEWFCLSLSLSPLSFAPAENF